MDIIVFTVLHILDVSGPIGVKVENAANSHHFQFQNYNIYDNKRASQISAFYLFFILLFLCFFLRLSNKFNSILTSGQAKEIIDLLLVENSERLKDAILLLDPLPDRPALKNARDVYGNLRCSINSLEEVSFCECVLYEDLF